MEISSNAANTLEMFIPAVRKIVIEFVRDEVTKAGFEKAVLGLSGGVDSALVAIIAAEALGRENVTAVKLPYRTSDPSSRIDADAVIRQTGIGHREVDITPMVDPHLERNPGMSNVRKGNIMARTRMIVLYDISAQERSLVLGTSNKTELLLGYGTQFGDLASAINPIGDLYKTQVWQLAAAMQVPQQIINKKPTADLWAGQTDEEELGFEYRMVDALLYHMIDERLDDTGLVRLGFKMNDIERVRNLVRLNQFKRRPPIIAKISHRTINVDFRYPRDWGI